MSERERWVVYPLLFLALGAALRDKLVDRTTTKSIRCQELVIEDEPTANQEAKVLAKIGRIEATSTTPAIGFLYVRGEVDIEGIVNVDGIVNAKEYAYQNLLFTPNWQPLHGIIIPKVIQPPQQPDRSRPNPNKPKAPPKSQPVTPPSSADDGSAAAK